MIKYLIGIFVFISTYLTGTAQQETLFTQFMYNKLALNDAFAGHYDNIKLTAVYRNQWSGFPGAPKTALISGNIPFQKQKIGLGVALTRTSIGVTDRLSFKMSYAYHTSLAHAKLSIGLNASIRQFKVDFTDPALFAIHDLSLDPAIDPVKESRGLVNFGLGAMYHNEDYYIGVSIPRFLKSNLDFDEAFNKSVEERHFYLMGGKAFTLTKDWIVMPQAIIKYVSKAPIDIDLNGIFQYRKYLHAGINFSLGGETGSLLESIDFIFGIEFLEQWRIGFSYDITLSEIRSYENGSMEFIVQFIIPKKIKKDIINPRYF